MRFNDIRSYKDEHGIIRRVVVTSKVKGETVSKAELIHGNRYRVEPLNPQKLKHRGRAGILVGFVNDDLYNPYQAKIKFEDSGRVGRVDITDLIQA